MPGWSGTTSLTGGTITKDIDFAGFAALTIEAAEARFGAGSSQAKAVRDAWATVKVTTAAGEEEGQEDSRRRPPRRQAKPEHAKG